MQNINSIRINQLRNIIKNIENKIPYTEIKEFKKINNIDVAKEIENGKKLIKTKIYELINVGLVNKSGKKQRQLHRFIDSYIKKLSKFQIELLYKKINYIGRRSKRTMELFEDYILFNGIKIERKYEDLFLTYDEKSIHDFLYDILINTVLLPESENQKDFNNEMYGILNRFELNVNRLNKDLYLLFEEINSNDIIEIIDYFEDIKSQISGNIKLDGIISSIDFNFSQRDFENGINDNNYSIGLIFERRGDNGIDKEYFLHLINELGFMETLRNNSNYLIFSDRVLQLYMKVYDNYMIDNEGGVFRSSFKVDFYTKENTIVGDDEFLDNSLNVMIQFIEYIANYIYKKTGEYPEVPNFISIKSLLEDIKKLYEEESSYDDSNGGLKQNTLKRAFSNLSGNNKISSVKKLDNNYTVILEKQEEELLDMIIDRLKNKEHYKKYGNQTPKGMILYGPHGTGKTLCALKISKESDSEFINVDLSQIKDMYVGESEKKIKKVFDDARKKVADGKQVVLFFDEADGLLEQRGDIKTYNEGVISVVLSEMDGIDKNAMENIFIIFTTNRLEVIDKAIKDRFNYFVKLDLPSYEKRIELFKLHVNNIEKKSTLPIFGDIDYEILAKKTDKKSGRFINKLLLNAKYKFEYKQSKNPGNYLITTEDILNEFSFTQIEEKQEEEKKVGFLK